jgi:hypothetical protein
MRKTSRFMANKSVTSHLCCMTAAFLLFPALVAQSQQTGSLGDAARQARAQKQAQPVSSNNQAQQIANELSEDQNDNGAPGGFKSYNTGDYKIWVPAPYRLEGHDDAGVVLSGPMMGSKHPIVLLGTPIVAHFENDDNAFQDAASHFAHLYAQSASCTKATVASHSAFQCGMAAATLLGQHVAGNAVFVRNAGNIYPVFCLAPSDSHTRDWMNNTNNTVVKSWGNKSLQSEDDDFKNVLQKCDTVFQSIRIAQVSAAQDKTADSGKTRSSAAKSTITAQTTPDSGKDANASSSEIARTGSPTSLAEIAHGLRQPGNPQAAQTSPSSETPPAQSSVPAGFKAQPFTYCKSQRDCWDASVLVPSDAQLVSSDCKQYVFETKVQGVPFLLMAGPAGADACANRNKTDASQARWNELAESESTRAPGTFNTISSQQATIDGKPAVITQIGFRKGTTSWMGKRAELENNGVPLVVGCMAPRDHFADGDAICSRLIESLQLP